MCPFFWQLLWANFLFVSYSIKYYLKVGFFFFISGKEIEETQLILYRLSSHSYISIFMYHIMNKILLSPTKYFGHFRFSTSKVLEDWEYVSYIHKKLKENNINEAMSYLINVHIKNIVESSQWPCSWSTNFL